MRIPLVSQCQYARSGLMLQTELDALSDAQSIRSWCSVPDATGAGALFRMHLELVLCSGCSEHHSALSPRTYTRPCNFSFFLFFHKDTVKSHTLGFECGFSFLPNMKKLLFFLSSKAPKKASAWAKQRRMKRSSWSEVRGSSVCEAFIACSIG